MYENKEKTLERKLCFVRAAVILVSAAILLLALTVFARTTYVITDGNCVMVHTTLATDPKTVLGEAGLKLGTNDTYTTHESDGVSQIRILREQTVLVDYYGEPLEVMSPGESVEELLARMNLSWNEEDFISKPLNSKTYSLNSNYALPPFAAFFVKASSPTELKISSNNDTSKS